MSSESEQKRRGRVRPPRVHIEYEVHKDGAMEIKNLPFVVGVLTDLSGQPKKGALKALKDRSFVKIDRDNINDVLKKQAPHLVLEVPDKLNKLTGEAGTLKVDLNFQHLDDFEPPRVAEQVEPLKKLLEVRQRLNQLQNMIYGGNKDLEELLDGLLSEAGMEKRQALAQEMGIGKPAASHPEAPQPEETT